MRRLVFNLLSVWIVLGLFLAGAPQACIGDGEGNPCRAEACACVAACSCQQAHRRAAEAVSECCIVEDGGASASACHGPGQWPHFAPADKQWQVGLPPQAIAWAPGPLSVTQPASRPDRPVSGALPLPDKPPRSFS
jgi:hypothetical protein